MFADVPDKKLPKWEQGLEPTEREVNIQEWALEFSAPTPNPLRKPRPQEFPFRAVVVHTAECGHTVAILQILY